MHDNQKQRIERAFLAYGLYGEFEMYLAEPDSDNEVSKPVLDWVKTTVNNPDTPDQVLDNIAKEFAESQDEIDLAARWAALIPLAA